MVLASCGGEITRLASRLIPASSTFEGIIQGQVLEFSLAQLTAGRISSSAFHRAVSPPLPHSFPNLASGIFGLPLEKERFAIEFVLNYLSVRVRLVPADHDFAVCRLELACHALQPNHRPPHQLYNQSSL